MGKLRLSSPPSTSRSTAKAQATKHVPIKASNLAISTGDCVFIRSSDVTKPFVAQIVAIRTKGRIQKIEVLWYYTPEESKGGRKPFHGAKELFFSDHKDTQPIETIEGKCTVHTLEDYMKLESVEAEDFFCRFKYESTTGKFCPDFNETLVYCECKMPYNPDITMIGCEKCENWSHPSCIGITDGAKDFVCSICADKENKKDDDGCSARALLATSSKEEGRKHHGFQQAVPISVIEEVQENVDNDGCSGGALVISKPSQKDLLATSSKEGRKHHGLQQVVPISVIEKVKENELSNTSKTSEKETLRSKRA